MNNFTTAKTYQPTDFRGLCIESIVALKMQQERTKKQIAVVEEYIKHSTTKKNN